MVRARLAVAAIAGLLTVVATYALLRLGGALLGNEPDPTTVLWPGRIAMFWRLGIGAYVGGAAAILVYLAAGARLALTARIVLRALLPVAALIALQGILVP